MQRGNATKRESEKVTALISTAHICFFFLFQKLETHLQTCVAECEWEKILLEFCNCKYLPEGIADVLVLFITFVNYDDVVTGKEGSSHWLNSQGSTFLYP